MRGEDPSENGAVEGEDPRENGVVEELDSETGSTQSGIVNNAAEFQ